MKIAYSNIPPEFRKTIEKEAERQIAKLNRLLKHTAPDLVVLHGSLEKTPRKVEYNFSLNLKLPTGTLHASGAGAEIRSCTKAAFAEIEMQVKKHQEKLRKDYLWKRKRAHPLSGRGAGAAAD
jgi:ribosome-associated translation inhibitor RaiA